MIEFISLVQVNIPPFVIKAINRFTISYFDFIPWHKGLNNAFDIPDGETFFRKNFLDSDYFTNNFILNTKEAFFFCMLLIIGFLLITGLLCCIGVGGKRIWL